MKTYTLSTLALASSTALAGFSVGPHSFSAGKSRQHRALAGRAILPPTVAGNGSSGFVLKKRAALSKRKTLGTGDSATYPSNAAEGTFDASAGCTVWHTVSAGEVCLGLIDKSSASFTMALFHTYNPSLSGDCDNLKVGAAYCVDNAPIATATDVAVATPPKVAAVVSASSSGKSTKTDSTPDDDDEDCDNDDEDDEDDEETDDDENCEDDGQDEDENTAAPAVANSRVASTPAAVKVTSTTSSAAPKATPAASTSSDNSNNDNQNDESSDNISSSSNDNSSSDNNSSSSSASSLVSAVTGHATYYLQNGNKGACGNAAQDSDYVVALYTSVYGSGSQCGKKITITNTSNGKTATAQVADMCPGCSGSPNNIDLSKGLFEYLSNNNLGAGVLPIRWAIQ